ncbi:MAG: efflux RND transporter permease subunit [Thermoguttaceae bacterium]|nr:efflux RND transporter permease subunit [Thermoguttaceae bacterium]
MLNTIIRFSLRHRLLIAAIAVLIVGYGTYIAKTLPIDVFPDLNRPRVTVMTEAGGMAPEEVEAMITIPIESVMNGAMGVQTVRSASGVGMSIVTVEFDWGTDIYIARQTANERLALAAERIPSNLSPQLTPISSIMGQILMIGIRSETGETSPMELRTLADWVVTPRIQKIAGISQVMQIGGERKQFQVLINPASMLTYGVTLAEIESVLEQSDSSVTGGYIDSLGPNEYLVRGLGRIQNISDLQKLVVTIRDGRAVLLEQVATVSEGAQIKRGDASVFVRKYTDEQKDHHEIEESPSKSLSSSGNESVSPEEKANPLFVGGPAVVLNLTKQPGADTRLLTEQVKVALVELQPSLPKDVRIDTDLYQQKTFIDLAINNVMEALRDGGILVAVVLFLFLLNFRTTLITLTAIPISVLITALVFHYFGLSINTMTLGGIAVAIGELVDDAIVDVENIFRRLRENDQKGNSEPALRVIFHASCEIRNSIVFSTMIIVIVFIPLFALSGMEGRFFVPLGIAYMVSIASSLLVSLTVTPVLSYWLLPRSKAIQRKHEGFLLSGLQWIAAKIIRFSLRLPKTILLIAGTGAVIAIVAISQLEQDFLPPFDEGVAQLNVMLPPGTSLARSKEVAELVEARLQEIDGVRTISLERDARRWMNM